MSHILCHSDLCTEQLIYISALSRLRESAEISAVRYTYLNGTVSPCPWLRCIYFYVFLYAFAHLLTNFSNREIHFTLMHILKEDFETIIIQSDDANSRWNADFRKKYSPKAEKGLRAF